LIIALQNEAQEKDATIERLKTHLNEATSQALEAQAQCDSYHPNINGWKTTMLTTNRYK
jgi:hypothetical protein